MTTGYHFRSYSFASLNFFRFAFNILSLLIIFLMNRFYKLKSQHHLIMTTGYHFRPYSFASLNFSRFAFLHFCTPLRIHPYYTIVLSMCQYFLLIFFIFVLNSSKLQYQYSLLKLLQKVAY